MVRGFEVPQFLQKLVNRGLNTAAGEVPSGLGTPKSPTFRLRLVARWRPNCPAGIAAAPLADHLKVVAVDHR